MPKQSISDFLKPQTTTPVSTNVHSNIDSLIVQSKLDEFDRYGSMRTTPLEYKGGVDDVVANIAMNPMMTLKSLGSIGKKLLQKPGLSNPLYHFTDSKSASNILKAGTIRGTDEAFPGKGFKGDRKDYWRKERGFESPAVSVTRDPKWASRGHGQISSDVRFIIDKDKLAKKGIKMQPYSDPGYEKTLDWYKHPNQSFKEALNWKIKSDYYKPSTGRKMPQQMNPTFEFEERVRGNIPSENIKMIDLIRFSPDKFLTDINNQDLIKTLVKSDIPKIKSQTAYNQLLEFNKRLTSKNWEDKVSKQGGVLHIADTRGNLLKYIDELLNTPTYKFDPFKR